MSKKEMMPERPTTVLDNTRADRVKSVARLVGRSARRKTQRFLAEGPQSTRELLKAHLGLTSAVSDYADSVQEIFISTSFPETNPDVHSLVLQASERGNVRMRYATDNVLRTMSDAVNPQGIVIVGAIAQPRELSQWFHNKSAPPRIVAVLCRVQDPGNAGTIIRAADACGADAVMMTTGSVDALNPKTIRSTAGSLFHLPVFQNVDLDAAAQLFGEHEVQILAADGTAQVSLAGSESLLQKHTAWLFGNESQGLNREELTIADTPVSVPLYGQAESLNVAMAASVCLYSSAMAQSS